MEPNNEDLIDDLLAEASTLRGPEGQKHFAREVVALVRSDMLNRLVAFGILEHMMVTTEHRERGLNPDAKIHDELTEARNAALERTAALLEEIAEAA